MIMTVAVIYLGVQLESGLRDSNHVKRATMKANLGAKEADRRHLIMSVEESVDVNGASIWFSKTTKFKCNKGLFRPEDAYL